MIALTGQLLWKEGLTCSCLCAVAKNGNLILARSAFLAAGIYLNINVLFIMRLDKFAK